MTNPPLVDSQAGDRSVRAGDRAVEAGDRSVQAGRFLDLVAAKLLATEEVFRRHLDSDARLMVATVLENNIRR